jgi:tripartite ATP-independent transporter DctM subunit
VITFLIVVFAFLLIIGAPIAVALGLSSMLGIQFFGGGSLVTAGQRVFEGMNSFALLAVPLYTFAGLIMGKGGIAKRIIDFCYSVVGHIYGGLAHVNVLASMVFAGISGSAAADTAGVSGMMMPQMMAKKYSREFTVAVTAISSTIGIIIPPSIPMVVIAGILNVSTGKLFLGGIIPGIMLGIAQMIVSYFMAKKENVPREESKFQMKSLWKAFRHSIFALFMPFLIMGSILSGFVSPTEAGVIAVLYSLFVGGVIYRELKWKDIKIGLLETARTCGKIFILLGAGALFSKLLTSASFHIAVQNLLLSITTDPTLMLILNLIIILIVTCFMDSIATLTMFMPVLYPVIESVGVDPILFCVLVVVCIGVGLVTPPVGVCLYIACDLMKLKIIPATKALIPFLIVTLFCIGLMIIFPQVILWPASWI